MVYGGVCLLGGRPNTPWREEEGWFIKWLWDVMVMELILVCEWGDYKEEEDVCGKLARDPFA